MQPDQQALDELVTRIVEAVHPLKIILFGSAARGEMGPDSDVDVMVVMPEGTHRLDTRAPVPKGARCAGSLRGSRCTANDLERLRKPWADL